MNYVDTRPRLNAISLFSGIGGLDLGVRAAFPGVRTVCYVEREAYAAGVLAARMADGSLDAAPIWTDVTTFDPGPWRGVVDCIIAGFPCQDLSLIGDGAGIDGKRSGLFSEVVRVARGVGSRFIFLENVAAITLRGIGDVLGALAALGFDAEWGCVRATAAGAPHSRDRWWCLAHAKRERSQGKREEGTTAKTARRKGRATVDRYPPGILDGASWARVLSKDPRFAPSSFACVRRMADGIPGGMDPVQAYRASRLRALGNAVAPDQAAIAFRALAERAGLNELTKEVEK